MHDRINSIVSEEMWRYYENLAAINRKYYFLYGFIAGFCFFLIALAASLLCGLKLAF